jgi:hypothetical protein
VLLTASLCGTRIKPRPEESGIGACGLLLPAGHFRPGRRPFRHDVRNRKLWRRKPARGEGWEFIHQSFGRGPIQEGQITDSRETREPVRYYPSLRFSMYSRAMSLSAPIPNLYPNSGHPAPQSVHASCVRIRGAASSAPTRIFPQPASSPRARAEPREWFSAESSNRARATRCRCTRGRVPSSGGSSICCGLRAPRGR